jgi:hypothetical protein
VFVTDMLEPNWNATAALVSATTMIPLPVAVKPKYSPLRKRTMSRSAAASIAGWTSVKFDPGPPDLSTTQTV